MDYSPEYGRYRALLRKIRKEAGLSQAELAQKLGKPQTFVSKSELGERRVDYPELRKFCAACKITVREFDRRYEQALISIETQPKRRRPRKMDEETGRLMHHRAGEKK
jgi:transcriptional regulator with XRE-family HTH domain